MERIQSAIEKARARRAQAAAPRPDEVGSGGARAADALIPEVRTEALERAVEKSAAQQASVPPGDTGAGAREADRPRNLQDHAGPVHGGSDLPPLALELPEPEPAAADRAAAPLSQQAIQAAWAQLTPCTLSATALVRKRILTLQSGGDAVHFDQIRTKVLQTMRARRWKRLAITSPLPSSGKSTLALNLALSLARQPDLRTVLLELDLRRPSLARLLGLRQREGIAAWLEGRTQFSDHAVCWNHNLAILPGTAPMRDAAELLASRKTAEALARMEAQYAPDMVICDMPPMLVGDDMMAFAAQADAALIVVAAEENTVKQIDACETDLARETNVMGVVLNKCQHLPDSSDYGYYYG